MIKTIKTVLFLFFYISMANAITIDQFSDKYVLDAKQFFPLAGYKYENDSSFINMFDSKKIENVKNFYTEKLEFLNKNFNTKDLNYNDLITYKILKQSLENDINSFNYKINHLLALNQISSIHLHFIFLGSGSGDHIFKTTKDYENWLEKMDTFANSMEDVLFIMQEGIDKKIVLQKSLIEKMIPQFESVINSKLEENPFYSSVLLLKEDNDNIAKRYADLINNKIIPVYKKILIFLKEKYIPNAGQDTGICQYVGGDDYYKFLIKLHAETDLTPDEIHNLGLKEVAKIEKEIEEIKIKINFTGSQKDLLSSKNVKHFKTEKEILDYLENIHQTVNKNVGKLFSVFPKTPFIIKEVEKYRAASASPMYIPGDLTKNLPGIYYVPIINPSDFSNASGLESTFVHEAIPGHHYQISLQQENINLSKFRKEVLFTAMVEGWALYTESLGKELGVYRDPLEYLGYLNMSMMRAVRLVVDTGLHSKHWTKQQAIDYSKKYLLDSDKEIENSIERYMAIPGQALSYKIGYFKIIEMRDKYQKQLGDKFDLRSFHDALIANGSVTIEILEDIMENWANKF